MHDALGGTRRQAARYTGRTMATSESSRHNRERASGRAPQPPAPRGAPAGRPAPQPGCPPVIEFRGVSKRYPSGDLGLDHATFAVNRGEFVFLVGSTGSGKSTVMRLLIKEVDPTEGVIRVAGHDLTRDHPPAGPVLPAQHRRGLPGLQAPAQPDGVRQRGLRAPGDRRHAQGDPGQGAGHPAPDRAVAQAAQLSRPALRRRAAARVDRPGVREPSAPAAGRRAHRQPRPGDEHRHHASPLPDQPHRHDRAGGHPRPGDGGQDAPARARALARPDRPRRGGRPVHAGRDHPRVRPPHAGTVGSPARAGRSAPELATRTRSLLDEEI